MAYLPSLEVYAAFKRGEGEAFKLIWNGLYRNAWYFVTKRWDSFNIDRAFEVDDILASVFIKLWIHRDKIERPQHLYDFVFKCCRTEMIDLANKTRSKDQREEEISYLSNLFEHQLDFLTPDILQILAPYIDKMPQKRSGVLKMYLSGKSTAEIQSAMGMKQQTVLNHRTLAIDKLRSFKKMLLDY